VPRSPVWSKWYHPGWTTKTARRRRGFRRWSGRSGQLTTYRTCARDFVQYRGGCQDYRSFAELPRPPGPRHFAPRCLAVFCPTLRSTAPTTAERAKPLGLADYSPHLPRPPRGLFTWVAVDGQTVTDYHHLASTNAPRRCGGCGAAATVYDHAVGFRCGACGDYPARRRAPDTDADKII